MGKSNKIIFDIITMIKTIYMKMVSGQIIDQYLRNNDVLKINLGCGNNHLAGWLNCDIYPQSGICYVDCTKRLPFDDSSVDYIFIEHMIEHMELPQIIGLIEECSRVLKTKRTLRLVTPDLDSFLLMVSQPESEEAKYYIEWYRKRKNDLSPAGPVRALNSIFYEHEHRFILNMSYLTELLSGSGFKRVRRCTVGNSETDILSEIEKRGEVIGDKINRIESLVIEADKS